MTAATRLPWATVISPPRVHYATLGPWLFVVQPYTTNRFAAWTQRIGWERGEQRMFKSLADAKAWCEQQAKSIEGAA